VSEVSRLTVLVTAGARRSEIVGRHGNGWKALVAAAPERGRANAALVTLLAEVLAVPRDRVSIVAGQTVRRKVVEVQGLGQEEAHRRLQAAAR
jgi:uncharacterized protein